VPFLHADEIEAASLSLIGEYGRKFGDVRTAPILVEEILEAHLGLELGFDDLPRRLGVPDVLGATWIEARKVLIDQSLDPTVNPAKEGRFRFTVAHELGHWELHRNLFKASRGQGTLFEEPGEKPSIVCRSRSKEPIEWPADMFAGYLLMPTGMVIDAWKERCGSTAPYVAIDEIADLSARWSLGPDETPTVAIARSLARDFHVSGQAMQIRLVDLGLIQTSAPAPDLWKQTATALRAWLSVRGQAPCLELFLNARGQPLTRSGFASILAKHVEKAATRQPSLATKRVSPHVLRHTCAMHTLEATQDIRKVALWLGHATVQTTEVSCAPTPARSSLRSTLPSRPTSAVADSAPPTRSSPRSCLPSGGRDHAENYTPDAPTVPGMAAANST